MASYCFFSAAVTATLFEDATNAKLLGGQDVITANGMETTVAAAASCGFRDGINDSQKSKAAGLCVYWHAAAYTASTWTTAV